MHLDATDKRLIRALQQDGRMSNAALADEAHLSPSACHRRVRQLEAAGIIKGYGVQIDRRAVGRGTTVFVEITLQAQSEDLLDRFEAGVRKIPDVVECHLMAGSADYLLKILAANSDDFARIHRQHLSRLPGVAQMHSSFGLRTVIAGGAVPLD